MSNMTLMFQEKDPEFVPLMGIVKKYTGPRFLMSKAGAEKMILPLPKICCIYTMPISNRTF